VLRDAGDNVTNPDVTIPNGNAVLYGALNQGTVELEGASLSLRLQA
jgi:hypothetical protein